MGKQKAFDILREEFLDTARRRSRDFLREAQSFYGSHRDESQTVNFINPAAMEERFRALLRAAMRIPALESLFPEPWPAAARRVLPSHSPQRTATVMWGPVLAWSVLELLTESVNAPDPQRAALDLFDRLRLREPLAHAFEALGFEGEESWRVAARIKVGLLIEAEVFASGAPEARTLPLSSGAPARRPTIPILSPALWQDPDVCWLTGVHRSGRPLLFCKGIL